VNGAPGNLPPWHETPGRHHLYACRAVCRGHSLHFGPDKVDGKTRSKWSRALRVAEAFKSWDESIKAFVKGQGGINGCAARIGEIAKDRR